MTDMIDRLPEGYTAGPWSAVVSEISRGHFGIYDNSDDQIAVTFREPPSHEWEPNAALIALAPEMADEIRRLTAALAQAEVELALLRTGAAGDVIAERERQVVVEGWTVAHDDQHTRGEMARAAACYILDAAPIFHGAPTHEDSGWETAPTPKAWPWHWSWWKPKGRRRDLVRAAALLIAEIERLDRAVGTSGGEWKAGE